MKHTPYIQILYHIYIFIYNIPKTNKQENHYRSTNKGLLNELTQLTTQTESLHILSIQQLLFIHSHRRQKCAQYNINTETPLL